jgi:hypothetical protein
MALLKKPLAAGFNGTLPRLTVAQATIVSPVKKQSAVG